MARLRNFIYTIFVLVQLTVSAIAITNSEFRRILEGRCEEYQKIFRPIDQKKNCTNIASTFLDVFKTRSAACKIRSFENFVNETQHHVPANKGIMWSGGIKHFIEQISSRGNRYMPLSFTLTGYMLDDLQICKDVMVSSQGCQGCSSDNVENLFWDIASEYFAKSVSGKIVIVLSARTKNGKESIYYDRSTLARIEIPNLPEFPTVKSVEVWPFEPLSVASKDLIKNKCNQVSVIKLKGFIDAKKIPYKCVDPSKTVLFAMCLNDPHYCSLPSTINGQAIVKPQMYLTAAVLASAIILISV